MRTFSAAILLLAAMSACSGSAQKTAIDSRPTSNSETANTTSVVATSPEKTPDPKTPSSSDDAKPPVEYAFDGITPDKEEFSYKIKVNTSKPISQVDIATKYLDAQRKVISETTIAWQNIVKSKREPIEEGKTYDVKGYLEPGATKVETVLKRVFFADGSSWNAQ